MVVNRLCNIERFVVSDKKSLQRIVLKSFAAKFNVLVANVRKYRCLRVQVDILSRLCNDASFEIAEQHNRGDFWTKTFRQ